MPAVSAADGPVAVTGASGYIGSWIVQDLVEHGYTVHACVRDVKRPEKVDHLLALNGKEGCTGQVKLFAADLFKEGSYDDAFAGCAAVVHAAAAVGYNKETPQEVYDGCFTQNKHVVDAVNKAGTVKRFVFTSSGAAVVHPHAEGYVFTEKDWCDQDRDPEKWREADIPTNRDLAYAMAKAATERMINELSAKEETTWDAVSTMPSHVIGPLMCANHDQGWSWQNCIKQMLQGKPYTKVAGGRMLWNIVDVRDVAIGHRLCLESKTIKPGSRYLLCAADPSYELFTWQLQKRMQELFPDIPVIGGEEMEGDKPAQPVPNPPFVYCTLAKEELGLKPIDVNTTIKDTGLSLQRLNLL
ncbi:dihydroflavonone isomerase [Salpingoeca rosetta]|uniref:Dihydroflavonone isomerase n=1 Tax=Salpingoeca rosetta (strain ATCC 50818 / BSB-021) TaxID=946362 RepID=F2UNB2_SALR5|nr:dihydroflavonone isomerase [Salpingoeca rosetta]EGD79117.1 dihydroflavonone isomerase [Salpingoeca rosetta]|eukprot:XP_004989202.1 dihydroflavonone isomerase [Salpingoeca rosetta]